MNGSLEKYFLGHKQIGCAIEFSKTHNFNIFTVLSSSKLTYFVELVWRRAVASAADSELMRMEPPDTTDLRLNRAASIGCQSTSSRSSWATGSSVISVETKGTTVSKCVTPETEML